MDGLRALCAAAWSGPGLSAEQAADAVAALHLPERLGLPG
jgi:hypothetical protein